MCVPHLREEKKGEATQAVASPFCVKGGDSVRKLPDLYELLAADAKRTEPTPPEKRVPAYLRQYTSPELRERARSPRTPYRDPTGDKAVNNAEPKRRRRRRRRRALQP